MICPHCQRDIRRKERGGNRCSKCGGRFAIEPYGLTPKTTDVRMNNAAMHLSAHGTVRYTEGQLRWRLLRNRLKAPVFKQRSGPLRRRALPRREADYRQQMINPWRMTYGQLPVGLVLREDARAAMRTPAPGRPRAVVVGHDEHVLGCLAINDVPAQLGVDLAWCSDDAGAVRHGVDRALADASVPVLALHDASVGGLGFLANLRARAGQQRVLDAGLTIAQARRAETLFQHAGIRWDPVEVPPGLVHDPADHEWLAIGCSLALAAVPPQRLIAAVDRAVMKLVVAGSGSDDVGRARAVGFL